jgi:hypothetical protein
MTGPTGTRRLRVGMSLSAHYSPGADVRAGLRDTMEQVALAEEAGLDTVLLGHHYLTRSQFLQPLSTVAYLAARTERIRLGFGVYLLPLHNPLALAEEFATLDHLSGGETDPRAGHRLPQRRVPRVRRPGGGALQAPRGVRRGHARTVVG